MTSTLAKDLAQEFIKRDYKWQGPDGLFVPDSETIQRLLDKGVAAMYSGKTASGEDVGQIEIGRLFMRRDQDAPDTVNIYLWIGELENEGS